MFHDLQILRNRIFVKAILSQVTFVYWTLQGLAMVDVFTCGPRAQPAVAISVVAAVLKPKKLIKYGVDGDRAKRMPINTV